ncbi:HpcH/HpaI aldolase/citrate lyase family protein [Amycolatopsis vancoresmycina]|uniref:Citrate lyase subunit beta n=1 Tax=Amycolatopsis vancoresmycina DSM 44592 TaxID=1292037 RepID=R1HTM1_9PSEU|nr:CoA ester lyase [Amycolatopsis vancoresmycina]EOD63686.1 citrate lyase subunit beta [Amycolatopsis vancoresmycina DSM 44592]
MAATTFLFVPGDRPDRFDKAVTSGADVVILDLEDAVGPAAKDSARASADAWLENHRAVVRINAPGTPWFAADAELVAARGVPVVVPKAETPGVLAGFREVVALVETAAGVERAAELAAVPSVTRLAFGSVDLAAELGVAPEDREPFAYARSRLVIASAAAGLAPPVDGVTANLGDDAELEADVRYARRLGFGGKLCIHPRQVPVARAAFAPTAAEREWARRVLTAGDSVSVVDGRMVDKPVLDRARRILGEG